MMRRYVLALLLAGSALSSAHSSAACDEHVFEAMVRDGVPAEDIVASCEQYLGSPSTDHYRTLRWAVGLGNVQLVSELVELGYWPADSEARDALLFYALEAPNDPAELMERLLSWGADVDRAEDRFNVVYNAIELDHQLTLDLLLRHSADPAVLFNPRNLFAAIGASNIVLLKMILDRGMDPNYVSDDAGVTPLMSAADRDATDEILLALISHGANCDMTDRLGNSVFTYTRSNRTSALLQRECYRAPIDSP